MSVLAKIRNRAGLLVTIIGIALFVFVLQSAFESGNVFILNSDRNVGEIGGKSISFEEFDVRLQEAVEAEKRNTGRSALDEATHSRVVEQVWNQFLSERIMNKEYNKLGVAVSEDELYELMLVNPHASLVRNLTDPQTGKVGPRFADPKTGELSTTKLVEFTQQMTPEEEQQWILLEDYVKKIRTAEKYNNLIKKGLYVTKSQAKDEYVAQNRQLNIKYVLKPYTDVPDSTITVSESELKSYYNQHQSEYKQANAERKLEYVAFDISPSPEDYEEVKQDMNRIAEEFKTKKPEEDSAFVMMESDNRTFNETYTTKGNLPLLLDSIMFNSPEGTVHGPYMEGNIYKIAKLIDTKVSADSAKVRHILVSYQGAGSSPSITRTKEQAKQRADSLLKAIKEGTKFETLVATSTDDPGSIDKGGDYGWFNAQSGFVEPFKNAGLDGKKGNISVVETQFGYHIIEVLDRKGESKKVRVAIIEKEVKPSPKTLQNIYVKSSEFKGKYTDQESFNKGIEAEKLNKRVAIVKEGDITIPGLESPKDLIRWAFEAEKGDISEPFELGDRFVIANLVEITEKGTKPLDQVKDDVAVKVKQEKKAEKYMAEFNTALAGLNSIDDFARKVNLTPQNMQNLSFNTYSLPGAGREDAVVGTSVALKKGELSKPIKGKSGVFVVNVESIQEPAEIKDMKSLVEEQLKTLLARTDYEVFEALKESANVIDRKSKFY